MSLSQLNKGIILRVLKDKPENTYSIHMSTHPLLFINDQAVNF